MDSSPGDGALGRLKGRLDDVRVHLAAELAVELRRIAAADLERCLDEVEENKGTLAARLEANGLLDGPALASLLKELHERDLRQVAAPSTRPPEIEAASKDPSQRIGKYVVAGELGRGGMGVVYKAWQEGLGRWVALKVLRSEASATAKARFLREAQLAAKVVHPHLVPIHEVSEEGGVACLAMAYMEGGSLEGKSFAVREALEVMADVASAVEEIHRHGIVHRDIKPANLLRDREGRVYLGDFGLARPVEEEVRLSASGAMIGTVSFAPPEQIAGRRGAVGPRSDVYSLGATLYALLCGHPPFEGEDVISTAHKVLDEEPVPLRTRRPGLHRDLETICSRAMEKRPEDRYPSAIEVAQDLRRFLNGESVAARKIPTLVRLARWTRRRAPAVAAMAVVLVAGVGAIAWQRISVRASAARAEEIRAGLDAARSTLEESRRLLTGGLPEGAEARRKLGMLLGRLEDLAGAPAAERHGIAAEARLLLGEEEQAEREYGLALAGAPEDPRLLHGRGRARLERAMWMIQEPGPEGADWQRIGSFIDLAAADFGRAVSLGGSAWSAGRLAEGWRRLADRKHDEAAQICRDEIARGSPELGYEVLLGTARFHQRDYQGAVAAFGEAVRRSPNQAFASFGRAVALDRLGDSEAAAADYGRVAELRPFYPPAFLNRAAALVSLGRYSEAVGDYERALRLDPADEGTRAGRLQALHQSGRSDEARREAEAFVKESPQSAPAWTILADLKREAGEAEARADYDRAIALDPSYPFAWAGRGILLKSLGRPEEAIDDLTRALELGEHRSRLAYWFFHRGVCRSNRQEWPEALADFNRAVEANPTDGAAWVNRGLARLALRDSDGARRDLEEGVRRNPSLEAAARPYLQKLRREE